WSLHLFARGQVRDSPIDGSMADSLACRTLRLVRVRSPRTNLETLMHTNLTLKQPQASLMDRRGFCSRNESVKSGCNVRVGEVQIPQRLRVRRCNLSKLFVWTEEPCPRKTSRSHPGLERRLARQPVIV